MKIKIQIRKKILIIIFTIVFLICGLFFVYYLYIKSNPIQNYNFLKNCSKNKETITCKAFIKAEYQKDGNNCYQTTMINEDLTFLGVELCIKNQEDNWENPYGNYEKDVPVLVNFKPKYFLPKLFGYNINISLLSDEEVLNLTKEILESGNLEEPSIQIPAIYIQENLNTEKNKYRLLSIDEDQSLLIFIDGNIDAVTTSGTSINLNMRVKFGDDILKIKILTDKITYKSVFEDELVSKIITSKEVSLLEKSVNYQVELLFNLSTEELQSYIKDFDLNNSAYISLNNLEKISIIKYE